MITVGAMRLPQPEPLDDLDAFLRGLEPDGGYWLTVRRLADHDHSGGVMGVPVAGAGAVDAYTKAESDALFLTPSEGDARYALTTHTHDAAYVNVTGDAMTGHLGVGTTNVYDLGTTALRWRKLWVTDLDVAGTITPALATQVALTALTTRVAALETSVTALKTHTHRLGTFGAGTLAPTGGIP